MLLIGVRTEGKGRRYLVQNWWPEYQYIEVDVEYLLSCEATIVIIKTPQYKIDFGCPAETGLYGEAAVGKE